MGPIPTQQVQSSVKMFSLIGSTIQDLIVHVEVVCMWAPHPNLLSAMTQAEALHPRISAWVMGL